MYPLFLGMVIILKLGKYFIYFPLRYRIQGLLCFQGPEEVTWRLRAVQNLERTWSRIEKCLMGNSMQFVTTCCALLPHARLNLHATWSEASFHNSGLFFISFDVLCQTLGQNLCHMPEYLLWIHLSFIKSDHASSATQDSST